MIGDEGTAPCLRIGKSPCDELGFVPHEGFTAGYDINEETDEKNAA